MDKDQKYFYPRPIPLPEDVVSVEIPSWQQAADAVYSDRCTPLDLFIAHQQPYTLNSKEFREELQLLLDYVYYCGGMGR